MSSRRLQLRIWLEKNAVYPRSKLALITCYLLALDVFLFALQQLSRTLHRSLGGSLGGWVSFLSVFVIALLLVLIVRRFSKGVLWRLRNRLIVTYVFIGVIPFVLLIALFLRRVVPSGWAVRLVCSYVPFGFGHEWIEGRHGHSGESCYTRSRCRA